MKEDKSEEQSEKLFYYFHKIVYIVWGGVTLSKNFK